MIPSINVAVSGISIQIARWGAQRRIAPPFLPISVVNQRTASRSYRRSFTHRSVPGMAIIPAMILDPKSSGTYLRSLARWQPVSGAFPSTQWMLLICRSGRVFAGKARCGNGPQRAVHSGEGNNLRAAYGSDQNHRAPQRLGGRRRAVKLGLQQAPAKHRE